MFERRSTRFVRAGALLTVFCCAGMPSTGAAPAEETLRRPNIVIVMTDDQGYGDLGAHGNPKILTPHLDQFAKRSTRMKNFYVSPVCSPTRASLLTGRYNYRTGVVDTFLGRSLMHPDEVTLAELLKREKYRTGIFGKWHLGDNYPLRALDQGFDEALVLKGGGIGQPSDPPGGTSYFDPILQHNGQPERVPGYCSDTFADAAIKFIEQEPRTPFFVYLAFNAPHTPLELPEADLEPYRQLKFAADEFPNIGYPIKAPIDPDQTARVYGMVTRIDHHFGRLLATLDALQLTQETIVIFLTDNGPQQSRYNGGLRGLKASVYDGGIRVPCYIAWPGVFPAGQVLEQITAHIDITPTLVEACGLKLPAELKLDGVSLLPLLQGKAVSWPERTLFFQWHRGEIPLLNHACAARSPRWKLVQSKSGKALADVPAFELFDMSADPFEVHNSAADHPEVVRRMRQDYEAWFADVGATRGFAPPRIALGTPHENPVVLTRQDWRGPRAGWGPEDLGHWEVDVANDGIYEVKCLFSTATESRAQLHFGRQVLQQDVTAGVTSCTFKHIAIDRGATRLEASLSNGARKVGMHSVSVTRAE